MGGFVVRLIGRNHLFIVVATALSACGTEHNYQQSYDSELTVAKHDIMIDGNESWSDLALDPADDNFPMVASQSELAVRYMGVDARGDPVLQVLAPDLRRTNVVVERAETDRIHLGAYGVREVTVIVVDATDGLLTYRLKHD